MADDAGIINQVLTETSFLYGANAAFVEDLYAKWSADPNSVEPSWRAFFATLQDSAGDVQRAAADPAWIHKAAPADPRCLTGVYIGSVKAACPPGPRCLACLSP